MEAGPRVWDEGPQGGTHCCLRQILPEVWAASWGPNTWCQGHHLSERVACCPPWGLKAFVCPLISYFQWTDSSGSSHPRAPWEKSPAGPRAPSPGTTSLHIAATSHFPTSRETNLHRSGRPCPTLSRSERALPGDAVLSRALRPGPLGRQAGWKGG